MLALIALVVPLQILLQHLLVRLRHLLQHMQHPQPWWTWMICTALLCLHRHHSLRSPRLTMHQPRANRHLYMGVRCLKCQEPCHSLLLHPNCNCQHNLSRKLLLMWVGLLPWPQEAMLLLSSKLVERIHLLIFLVNSSSSRCSSYA